MRLDRLRGGEVLAGGGGLLLLVAMFLPWFGRVSPYCVPYPGFSCGRNFDAWTAFDFADLLLLLTAISGVVVAVVVAANSKTDAPITSAALAVPIGMLGTMIVAYRILDPVGQLDRRIGLFLGLAGCIAITYGSWRSIRDERTS